MNWRETFDALCDRKMREADAEPIDPLETIEEHDLWPAARRIGSEWTRALYGGDAVLAPEPADRPAVSLVFVQTRDGNTGAADPAELGGGPTDMHLIYEGLSRVAADAVLAGAGSARGHRSFFSVWRRELIALREELGLPRHPAQIVASRDGRLDVRSALLFNVPAVRVILLGGRACIKSCWTALVDRPWIDIVPIEDDDWHAALATLRRDHGIHRISAIGGRRVATSLIDAGVVQDLWLTTTSVNGGEPDTPYYVGAKPPRLELVVRKVARSAETITFEQKSVSP